MLSWVLLLYVPTEAPCLSTKAHALPGAGAVLRRKAHFQDGLARARWETQVPLQDPEVGLGALGVYPGIVTVFAAASLAYSTAAHQTDRTRGTAEECILVGAQLAGAATSRCERPESDGDPCACVDERAIQQVPSSQARRGGGENAPSPRWSSGG